MVVSIFCYIFAIAFIIVDGSISVGALRTAFNAKSKEGYFIGFGSMLFTLLTVVALIVIAINLG